MSQADDYCRLAQVAIQSATTGQQLRNWWRNETVRRVRYGVRPEQEVQLAAMCKTRIGELTTSTT